MNDRSLKGETLKKINEKPAVHIHSSTPLPTLGVESFSWSSKPSACGWDSPVPLPSWGDTQTPSETEIADLWDWKGDQITTCAKMQTYPWGSKTEGTTMGQGTNLSTNYDTGQDNKCDPSAAFLGKIFWCFNMLVNTLFCFLMSFIDIFNGKNCLN